MKKNKKILVLLFSVLMVFTMAVTSIGAVKDQTISDSSITEDVTNSETTFGESLYNFIHNILGKFFAVFDKECPLCDKIHGKEDESSAYEYYNNNSQLIDVVDAEESDDVLTESEVKTILEGNGFVDYPITYEFLIDGEYCEQTEVSDDSSNKHPMYQTFYLSASGEMWAIYVINGDVFANPLNYNMESDFNVQLLITESNELTSYDDQSNKFYITIPYESEIITKTVDKINAETLDKLTAEEIDKL